MKATFSSVNDRAIAPSGGASTQLGDMRALFGGKKEESGREHRFPSRILSLFALDEATWASLSMASRVGRLLHLLQNHQGSAGVMPTALRVDHSSIDDQIAMLVEIPAVDVVRAPLTLVVDVYHDLAGGQ